MGRKGSGSGLSGLKLLAVTFKQLMQKKQLLLLPITMFIGAEQAFMAVGFTSVSIVFKKLRFVFVSLINFFSYRPSSAVDGAFHALVT